MCSIANRRKWVRFPSQPANEMKREQVVKKKAKKKKKKLKCKEKNEERQFGWKIETKYVQYIMERHM